MRVILVIVPLLLSGLALVNDADFGRGYSGIIIPGFASSKLRSRSVYDDCLESSLQFYPDDLLFNKFREARLAMACWIKCFYLDHYDQTDHPECKSRPVTGLSGIKELNPGFLTGPPYHDVWEEWLRWCHQFGMEAVAAPYDWRLSPTQLEERDLYFHKLKLTFETARKLQGRPSIVFAHSLGNNVFRFFLEWLRIEMAQKRYTKWLDEHIHAYFAIGAPLLGSVEILKKNLFGEQPVIEDWVTDQNNLLEYLFTVLGQQGTSRLLFNSFPSSLWMLPFSNCKIEEGWPTALINIRIPLENANHTFVQRSFSACEIANGSFFKAIQHADPDSKRVLQQLKKFYHDNPVLNPLTPWERPPIKNVYCIYAVNAKTEVGFSIAPSEKEYPNNWIIKDVIYEIDGTLKSRSGNLVDGHPGPISGDGKVPYNSLSWCKTWLGPIVNITVAPQAAEYNLNDVKVELNINITPRRGSKRNYITFYEDSESLPRQKTAVWEFDQVSHWNLLLSQALTREIALEIRNDQHSPPKDKFVSKVKCRPYTGGDCFWH